MTDQPKDCQAYQERDGSHYCGRCGFRWDMGDSKPNCSLDVKQLKMGGRQVGKTKNLTPDWKVYNKPISRRTQPEQDEINRRGIDELRECLKDD